MRGGRTGRTARNPTRTTRREPRRSRRAARPEEQWLNPDSGPQSAPTGRHGSHRRSDRDPGGGYGDRGYGDGGYGDAGYGADGSVEGGYARNGHAEGGYPANGYGDGRYAGNGYGDGSYDQGEGFGRTAGYPDSGYSEGGYPASGYPSPGYPASGSHAAGYPGPADAETYGGPAPYDGYRDGARGDAGYETSYHGFGRDSGPHPEPTYPPDPYAAPDPYGAADPYSAPEPYAAPDPYAAPGSYARGGSLGHTDPRGQTDPFSRPDPARGQTDPFSRPDPARGQTDPFSRPDPARGQTDPFARPDPRAAADPFGSAERYTPPAGYEDDTLGRGGPPSSTYGGADSYGELGSYGTQAPYGGPAGYETGDPFAGRDARGQRGVSPAGYDGPAGDVHGGGYDEHDYEAGLGHDPVGPPAADYPRRGDREQSYGRQAPVDDTGVTRRRARDPEDELDPDSARHNGFFRGFGASDDEVGHRPPKRKRSKAGMVAMIVIIVFLGGVVGAGAYGYHWYSSRHADWTGSGFGSVIVQVPHGGSAYGMSTVLVKDGVIAAAAPFRSAAEQSGKSNLLEPGYFRLHKHMSAASAWALIINPKARVQTTVGVPDGMRVSKVIALLAAKTGIPLSQFQAAQKDTSALGLPSWAKGNLEGFLWPATYNIQPGTSALAILQMMVKQFNTEVANMNLAADAQHAKFTEYQVIIAASLLEGEVPPQYYTKVSRVIDERLNQVPPWDLGFDSTVAYVLNKYIYNLTQSDLNVKSPYNTTKHPGLPPGPIDSPDAAAIQAVLHPAQGDWLYFVTVNKKGLTLFTNSSVQFNAWAQLAKQNGV